MGNIRPSSPPKMRHRLPERLSMLSASGAARGPFSGRLNQIFILTCVASFLLQLFGSIVSWSGQNGHSSHLEAPHLLNPKNSFRRQLTNMESASVGSHSLGAPRHDGRLRILLGILTADFSNDQAYRKRHRDLFELWNDERVCSLPDFKRLSIDERYRCEIIYTFVMGGNPDAPPILVDDSRPMFVTKPIKGMSRDVNDPDVTLVSLLVIKVCSVFSEGLTFCNYSYSHSLLLQFL